MSGPADPELLEIARRALAEYELEAPVGIRPIRLINNAVFEVTTAAGRFALRVHRPGYRTAAQIRSELQFLRALADDLRGTPVSVPRPVARRDGELLGEGERCCDLLTWVEGRELKPTRGLGPRSAFLLGEALGRLHDFAQRFEPTAGFELPTWDAETMFSSASPFRPGPLEDFLAPDALELFREVAERTRAVFAELGPDTEQWGVIHKDYVLVNCRFRRTPAGWELGVLDFDDVGWGYYLDDVAPLVDNLADFSDSYRRLRRAFLAGYRSVRALPPSLERHLPTLMAARQAVVLTWLAAKRRRGETDLPLDRYAEYRVVAMRECLARR
ncbi:MAG: phosphotransferase [Thermoleophilia bacterium]|nr:phosphotransferase [Thermoleophilia bacterium]